MWRQEKFWCYNDLEVVKVNLRGVAFLTNNTAAALGSCHEGTMPAVTSGNGLVLFIPRIFFHFYQFSSFPAMLSCQTGLSLLIHQRFPNILDHELFCLRKITMDAHILTQVNMQFLDDRQPNFLKKKSVSELILDIYEYITINCRICPQLKCVLLAVWLQGVS